MERLEERRKEKSREERERERRKGEKERQRERRKRERGRRESLFVCLFDFLTSSSTTRLNRGRALGQQSV